MTVAPLHSLPSRDVQDALKAGELSLSLGQFETRLRLSDKLAVHFFMDMYRDCPVRLGDDLLCDFSLHLRPPNLYRKYFRRQIVPDPGFHFPAVPLPAHLSPLSFEMGMNLSVALQCFRYVIFHAGVLAKNDGAIIMSAHSGGGKSTLTAAMMEEGFRLMSDEFAILDPEGTVLRAYPRPVSLKNQSIDVVRGFVGTDAVSGSLEGTPKGTIAYRRPRQSDIEQAGLPAKARLLLFPKFRCDAEPVATEIDLADAAMQLIASSPNYQVIGETAFSALMAMLDGIKAYEIEYGTTEDSVRLVKDLWQEARQ